MPNGDPGDGLFYPTLTLMILLINTHADVSSKARGLNLDLRLHLQAYFLYVSSEGSGKSVHMWSCINLLSIKINNALVNSIFTLMHLLL